MTFFFEVQTKRSSARNHLRAITRYCRLFFFVYKKSYLLPIKQKILKINKCEQLQCCAFSEQMNNLDFNERRPSIIMTHRPSVVAQPRALGSPMLYLIRPAMLAVGLLHVIFTRGLTYSPTVCVAEMNPWPPSAPA